MGEQYIANDAKYGGESSGAVEAPRAPGGAIQPMGCRIIRVEIDSPAVATREEELTMMTAQRLHSSCLCVARRAGQDQEAEAAPAIEAHY
jgi:hypothetical protein